MIGQFSIKKSVLAFSLGGVLALGAYAKTGSTAAYCAQMDAPSFVGEYMQVYQAAQDWYGAFNRLKTRYQNMLDIDELVEWVGAEALEMLSDWLFGPERVEQAEAATMERYDPEEPTLTRQNQRAEALRDKMSDEPDEIDRYATDRGDSAASEAFAERRADTKFDPLYDLDESEMTLNELDHNARRLAHLARLDLVEQTLAAQGEYQNLTDAWRDSLERYDTSYLNGLSEGELERLALQMSVWREQLEVLSYQSDLRLERLRGATFAALNATQVDRLVELEVSR